MKTLTTFKKIGLLTMTLVLSGAVLTGCSSTPDNSGSAAANYEVINLGHDGSQVVPATTTLKQGKDYKIVITPDKNGVGCMSTIKWAGTQGGDPVIEGRPIELVMEAPMVGEYPLVCNGMGMAQGKIIIEA